MGGGGGGVFCAEFYVKKTLVYLIEYPNVTWDYFLGFIIFMIKISDVLFISTAIEYVFLPNYQEPSLCMAQRNLEWNFSFISCLIMKNAY